MDKQLSTEHPNRSLKNKVQALVHNSAFNHFIFLIICINCILIGVETFHESTVVSTIQNTILWIYVVEIVLRWIGKDSYSKYFKDGWNYFDIFVVVISFVPSSGPLSVLRVLRVLRIFRAVKAIPELRLISNVLIRSLSSLSYTGLFFGIFIYIYAVMGVMLFKFKDYAGSAYQAAQNGYPDPYGSLSEACFTLFRILTGEDWTDLRYHLLEYSAYPDWVVTVYHVSWMILAAFLLINLVIGAVINNYDEVMRQERSVLKTDDHSVG